MTVLPFPIEESWRQTFGLRDGKAMVTIEKINLNSPDPDGRVLDPDGYWCQSTSSLRSIARRGTERSRAC